MYRGFPGKRYPAKKRIKYSFGKDEFQHGIRNRRQNGRFHIFRFLTNAKEAWCGVVFAKPSNCKFIFLGNLMLNGVEIPMDSQMRRARCRVFHEENERNRMNWLRSFFAALQGVFPYWQSGRRLFCHIPQPPHHIFCGRGEVGEEKEDKVDSWSRFRSTSVNSGWNPQ